MFKTKETFKNPSDLVKAAQVLKNLNGGDLTYIDKSYLCQRLPVK